MRLKIDWVACSGKEIYHFCFVLLCIRGQIPSTSPPGGLYSEGGFNGGFFALRFWGAYIWRGLYMEGLIFGILRYFKGKNFAVPKIQGTLDVRNDSMNQAFRSGDMREDPSNWTKFLRDSDFQKDRSPLFY